MRADVALAAVACFWGWSFVVVKDALMKVDPITFLALRFGTAALCAIPLAGARLQSKGLWRDGLPMSVLLFCAYWAQTVGLASTTPARSAFLTGVCVVLVPVVAWRVNRTRLGPAAIAAIGCAVFGMYVFTGMDLRDGFSPGDGWTLLCAVLYAIHIVFTGRLSVRHPAMALVAVQVVGVCVCSALLLPAVDIRLHWSRELVVALLVCGVLSSTVAIAIQTWAQSRTDPAHAALLFSLEPVSAAGISSGLGVEVLTRQQLVGAALIVCGVAVGELPRIFSGPNRGLADGGGDTQS